jgi:tRNA (cytidine/uridine-2'-O-)-methyltransferase
MLNKGLGFALFNTIKVPPGHRRQRTAKDGTQPYEFKGVIDLCSSYYKTCNLTGNFHTPMPHEINVVLVEPEIPMNTGTIGRLCLATGSTLHLIEPLGFEISDRRLKRAGLDYWKYVDVKIYSGLEIFLQSIPPSAQKIFFSTKGEKNIFQHVFQPGAYLFFGSETRGLPAELIQSNKEQTYRIPQYDERIRSINIANAVSVATYEAIRQLGV